MLNLSDTAKDVLDFWRAAGPKHWFAKNKDFDTEFKNKFYDAHFAAARGEFSAWIKSPESALALIILLDQYPRNSFRGTAHMFATDGLALSYARQALLHLAKIDKSV